jgi:hypothetical protein
MYAWLYTPMMDQQFKLQAGIMGLKYHSKYFPLSISKETAYDINKEHIERFEEDLIELVQEIFDPEVDFKQCEDDKPCLFCDYKFICGR